jgi:hypothetical protein
MAQRPYTASLQNQDRAGYSIIFRHPVRPDATTGKPGLRVRRGLGTRDLTEAERLKTELNELLAQPEYHTAGSRAEAARRYDARVVEIFYYKLTPDEVDPISIRDAVIPLPGPDADYRRVLLLGTTGAGKTTVLRQLIGTDPKTERFPSTSTAKTTVHDTEIVLANGPWRAVVTFVPQDEVREYLGECVSSAVLAAAKKQDDATVLTRLLDHVNQRYRFSYVLGKTQSKSDAAFGFEDDDDVADDGDANSDDAAEAFDTASTTELLRGAVQKLRSMAARLTEALKHDLRADATQDERVLEEIFEEELDNLLRDDEEFQELVDALMDEIERRFELLPTGHVSRAKTGWPVSWNGEWPVDQRQACLRALARFASNHAAHFGRLLTPLVNGVRVAGPFGPVWREGTPPKLVLLDGEGLGHVPRSSSSVGTAVSRRIDMADAVLLVDNAAQPMQAAPVAVMREVISTGNARKLIISFTHFDEVQGDNLPTAAAKARHVLASAENVLASFGEELGPFAERALRQRLESARFFLSGIDQALSAETKTGRDTLRQFDGLLRAIDDVIERPASTESRPVYDRINLVLAIKSAAESYLGNWFPRLGLTYRSAVPKEHWTRVRALSRRLAGGLSDEYDTLRPVADLRKELVEKMYVFFQTPLAWEGPEPTDDERQAAFDRLADVAAKRLLDVATRRVWHDRMPEWQSAFNEHGAGSSFRRARIIGERIVEPAAPIPDVTPSPDRNLFLHAVVAQVEAAAKESGALLR